MSNAHLKQVLESIAQAIETEFEPAYEEADEWYQDPEFDDLGSMTNETQDLPSTELMEQVISTQQADYQTLLAAAQQLEQERNTAIQNFDTLKTQALELSENYQKLKAELAQLRALIGTSLNGQGQV
jgi:chromosome segregation ATPase